MVKIPKSRSSVRSLARSIKDCSIVSEDLDLIDADKITKFYKLPTARFKTEQEIIRYYGYELGEQFGKGGFAVVFYAIQIKSKIPVACKKVDLKTDSFFSFFNFFKIENKIKSELSFDESKIEDLKNELLIMKRLQNPYIVKLYAHFVVDTNLFIFMKLANNGALDKYVKCKGVLSEHESQVFFAQTLVGLEHMHSLNIAHRDIKLENILLLKHPNQKITILISDFGLSRVISVENEEVKLSETRCGTSSYMAPEILEGKPFNSFLVDIWAMGVFLYVMLNNKEPFSNKVSSIQILKQKQKEWKFSEKMVNKPTESLINIMSTMLEPDPSKRPTILKLIQHPWINDEYLVAKNFFNPKGGKNNNNKPNSKPRTKPKIKSLKKPKSKAFFFNDLKIKAKSVITKSKTFKEFSKKKVFLKKSYKSLNHKKIMSKQKLSEKKFLI